MWGATPQRRAHCRIGPCFNPRARVGRDLRRHDRRQSGTPFQSTRPCGARPLTAARFRWRGTSFNPRARVGRDAVISLPFCICSCFNPRARVGRDSGSTIRYLMPSKFQSTRPCGARPIDAGRFVNGLQFQSTRPCGARHPHHNSLRDKDFFRVIREPMLPLDPKGTGQVAATQKVKEINMLLKCEPSRESHTA